MFTRPSLHAVAGMLGATLLAPLFAYAQVPTPVEPAAAAQATVPAAPPQTPPQGQAAIAAEAQLAAGAAPALPPADNAPEVLDKGPIHEAFAEPVVLEAGQAVKVDRLPPDAVNELPPDVRPEGKNIEWIPGYWMWNDDKNDFIWVSGVWRDIPPGRRWVPGHWTKVDAGYQWVSGFWAGEQQQEVQMLPNPPETLEVGPNSPAPADNYFWVPGVWIWQDGGYAWRAGYWYAGQENWLWVPDHYCYSPYGSVFVNGYWDYPLANRGLLYAPVWWSQPYYGYPGYYYRPYRVINTALLLTSLFINRPFNHYYYGYGWGPGYWNNGYWGHNGLYPWWGWNRGHGYDPFYHYHRWHDGHNHDDWADNVRRDFNRHQQQFVDNDGRPNFRPEPRATGFTVNNVPKDFIRNVDQGAGRVGSVNLRNVTDAERQVALKQVQNWKQIRESRVNAETTARASGVTVNGNAANNFRRGSGRGGEQIAGQAGASRNVTTGPNGNPQLRIDNPNAARPAFRLPTVDRLTGSPRAGGNVQTGQAQTQFDVRRNNAGGNVRVGGLNQNQIDSAFRRQQFSGRANNGGASTGVQGGGSGQQVITGRPQLEGQGNVQLRQGPSGRTEFRSSNRAEFQQGGNVNPGRRIEIPQGGGQQFTPRNFGNSGGGGGPTFRSIPSGGGESRNFRVPSGGGESRSFSVPSGGGQPSRSFSGGGGGGGPSVRNFSSGAGGGGGRPSFRVPSGGGGGGGQQMFRGGGGGGGRRDAFQGGGGGGGHGRGRNKN
jgi:hypothetical protein